MGFPWPAGGGAAWAGLCADGAVDGGLGAGPGCCPARAVSCACNLALVAWAGACAAAVAMPPSPARGWMLRAGAGAGAGTPLQLRPAHFRCMHHCAGGWNNTCFAKAGLVVPGMEQDGCWGLRCTNIVTFQLQCPAHQQDCCSGWCVPGARASGSSCSSAEGTFLGAPLPACGSAESRLLVVRVMARLGLSSAAGHALHVCRQKQPATIHCDRHLPKEAYMSGTWLICNCQPFRYLASHQSTGL